MKQRCLGCMSEYESDYGLCPYCGYEPGDGIENPLHLRPGTQLTDRYTVGRVLGYGGFGVTYIAFDNVLNQKVAIKEYLPSEFATRMSGNSQVSVFSGNKAEQFADGMLKFVDEAKRLAKFQGEEGIVRVFDSFEANETAYIAMEYLEGETLTSYLEREGKVPPEQAVTLLESVVRSLETVHQAGIIHRDIAPDNIFLTTDGRVKLIDFGAARYATTSHSRSLTVIIKPGYSPEEQYRSRGDQGTYTDVYALAAVLYRMVTGITPPDALERRAILENKKKDVLAPPSKYCKIDGSLENAILNAMNVRIEDRTATAQAFWKELSSEVPVKRRGNRIKALDWGRWPLGFKIGIPVLGLCALTLVGLLLAGVIGPKSVSAGNITMEEGMTRVPSVINYSIGVAQEMLDKRQLNSLISGRKQSDVIPVGMVLSQNVDAGQVVEVHTQVGLYISEQPDVQSEKGRAPDVMYYAEADAVELFRQQGIEPKLEYIYSGDVAEGLVIDQSAAAGDVLDPGAEVVLTISRGPDPDQKPADAEGTQDPDAPRPLKLNRTSLSLYAGDTVTLTASGGSGSYRWTSSAGNVASVQNGAVTAAGAGKAVITVSSGTEKATCSVTVREYSLTLSQDDVSMKVGDSIQLTASGAPAGTEIEWISDNDSVAAVREGLVTATGAGSVTITARAEYGGLTHDTFCRVTVSGSAKQAPEVNEKTPETSGSTPETVPDSKGHTSSIRDIKPMNLTVGGTATVSYSSTVNGRELTVTWISSNPSVASVTSSGVITGVSEGTATISAQTFDGGQLKESIDMYEVTVSAASSGWIQGSSLESSSEWQESASGGTPFWKDPDFDYEAYLEAMWGSAEG